MLLIPEPLHRILDLLIMNVRVKHRRAQISMTSNFLDQPDVFGLFVKVSEAGVSQEVRMNSPPNSCLLPSPLHHGPDISIVNLLSL